MSPSEAAGTAGPGGAGSGSARPTVFFSAGETSGDRHAAAVAREIRRRIPDASFVGLGGRELRGAGTRLLADLDDLAVMGTIETLRRAPYFLRLARRVRRALSELEVDLVIPVDYPGFNLALARDAKRLGIPVLYFIAPQVWAWKEGRARRLAETCDRVLTVFPFEVPLLDRYGVSARFVGHPLLDESAARTVAGEGAPPGEPVSGRARGPLGDDPPISGEARGALRVDPSDAGAPVLGLFPGSRSQEVERNLGPFVEAARLLVRERPELDVRIARPTHLDVRLYRGAGFLLGESSDVVRTARAAITKSGTITLELALEGVPMVVGYRTSRTTYAIARRVVKVDSIVLVNLVSDERIVPELIQDEVSAAALADRVRPLLEPDSPERARMLEGLARVRSALGETGCAGRVADEAVGLLRR